MKSYFATVSVAPSFSQQGGCIPYGSIVPGCQPQTEEEFKASLRSTFGDKVTDDNMHEYIQAYNTAIEQVIQGPNGMAVGPLLLGAFSYSNMYS